MKTRMPDIKFLAKCGLQAILLFSLLSAMIVAASLTKMAGGGELTQGFVMGFVAFRLPDIIVWLAARS